jgi:hypothetical protein
MKTRLYITSFFCAILTLGLLQNCAVDPLDDTSKFGNSDCARTDLPDTDGDGLNDKCEIALGSDPNSKDSNGNGIGDKQDIPEPKTPVPVDCLTQDPNNYPPECKWYFEANGARQSNTEDIARAGLLGESALNSKAPNGTKIAVQKQVIRIVNNGIGLGTDDGSGDLQDIQDFCTDKDSKKMTSFIYYQVVGTVKFCAASANPGLQDCEGTAEPTMLELCGPLTVPGVIPANTHDNQDIVVNKFRWTAGRTYLGKFTPHSLIKDEEADIMLTLTPSNYQAEGSTGVFRNLKLKFKKAFQIEGKVKNEYLNKQQQSKTNYVYMETAGNVDTLKNFKRSSVDGTINTDYATKYPKMLGPWRAE